MRVLFEVAKMNSASGSPRYLYNAFRNRGWNVINIDPEVSVFVKMWLRLRTIRLSKYQWFLEYQKLYETSSHAWKRMTTKNTQLIDRLSDKYPRHEILQIGGLCFPHMEYRQISYNLLLTYTMNLGFKDKTSIWVTHEADKSHYFDLEGELYNYAKNIFTTSVLVKNNLINEYNVDQSKIKIVGWGGNEYFLKNSENRTTKITYKILFIGYTFDLKGGNELVQAFLIAKKKIPKLQLIIIGPRSIPYNHEGIINVGTVTNNEELIKYYKCADIFVFPSKCDSFAKVLIEAMYMSLPCIAANINAIPEIIEDNVTGFIVELDNVNELADKIVYFYENENLIEKMGKIGRERALSKFTWTNLVEKISKEIA